MKQRFARKITPSGVTFQASYGPYDLGTYPSAAQASAAMRGAEAVHLERRKVVLKDKADREQQTIYYDATKRPKGLRLISGRWCVISPQYLGAFDSQELAQAARDALLAKAKSKPRRDTK